MRILSIGATGFIGKSTLEHLIRLGHEVIAFHHGERKPPAGTAKEIHGDYRRLSEYREDLQSQAPDVALHVTIANARQAADFMNTFRGFTRRRRDAQQRRCIPGGRHPAWHRTRRAK